MTKKYLNLEILQYFKNKISDLFCKTSIYDADGDGIIDNSKSLDGHSYAEIKGMINDVIEDGSTTSDSTWSSQKISEELKQKANTTDIPEVPLATASKSGLNRATDWGLIQNSDGTFEIDDTKVLRKKEGYGAQSALNIYVDAVNGDNATADGSESKPYKTLGQAFIKLPIMLGMSTVNFILADGSYTCISMSTFFQIGNLYGTIINVKPKSTNNSNVTITYLPYINISGIEKITFENINFNIGNLPIYVNRSSVHFKNCKFTTTWWQVFKTLSSNLVFENCELNCSQDGGSIFEPTNNIGGLTTIYLAQCTGTASYLCKAWPSLHGYYLVENQSPSFTATTRLYDGTGYVQSGSKN